jgi:hypothetical protein
MKIGIRTIALSDGFKQALKSVIMNLTGANMIYGQIGQFKNMNFSLVIR